jgi:hypothetical protein
VAGLTGISGRQGLHGSEAAAAYENGHSTDILVSMLRALEENVRSFERHRYLILDQLKNADRQRLARTASPSSVPN